MSARAQIVTPDRTTLLAFAAIVVLGGSNALAVKVSNVELAPFWGATVRFAVAAAVLLGVAGVRGIPLPRGRALVGSVLYGALNFAVFFALLYWALLTAPAGLAMVLLALAPLLTLLLAALVGLERLRARGVAGALVAAVGIAVVFGDRVGAGVPIGAALAVLGGAAAIAASSVVIKGLPKVHPVANNAVAMAVGAAGLVVLSILAGERWAVPTRLETWAALSYLVALGSVTMFVLYVFVIGRWTASATSYAVLLMPLVTVPAAAILAHESMTPAFALGSAMVLVGVYFGAIGRVGPGARHAVEPSEAPSLASPGCP